MIVDADSDCELDIKGLLKFSPLCTTLCFVGSSMTEGWTVCHVTRRCNA